MKVMQFIASKVWGGAEKSFVELCNALSKNIQIEVILFKENEIEENLDKEIKVHILSSNSSRYNPFLYLEIFQFIQQSKSDLVHTHSAKASEIAYVLNKFVSFLHIATKRNPRKGRVFNKIKYVTAVSKDVVRSINKKEVKLIYNGLLKEKTLEKRSPQTVFTLLAIGGLDKIKGFDVLIREIAKLDFPFHLNIVGEGKERENLESLIMQLDVAQKVTLLGYREDIPSLISVADLLIISSHSEGFGRVLVETLFYGKCILSTKVGLSMEILPSELLIDDFKIAEKIFDVYENKEVYSTIFRKVKEAQAKVFLLENNIHYYLDYYKEIVD